MGGLYDIIAGALDLIHDDPAYSGENLSKVLRIVIVNGNAAASFAGGALTIGQNSLGNTAADIAGQLSAAIPDEQKEWAMSYGITLENQFLRYINNAE